MIHSSAQNRHELVFRWPQLCDFLPTGNSKHALTLTVDLLDDVDTDGGSEDGGEGNGTRSLASSAEHRDGRTNSGHFLYGVS